MSQATEFFLAIAEWLAISYPIPVNSKQTEKFFNSQILELN